jgi:hypothetical protein
MALLSPQTGSIIESPGGNDRTGTAISTNIVIKVGPNAVGAVQEMSISENRTITSIDEIGTDGHIDSVPTKSTDISGTCKRIRYDRLRITEAFSRGFVHVASQRIPFDIVIIDKWNGDGANSIITTIKNVWIEKLDVSYNSENWIIADNMSWKAESISSVINGQNPAAQGGERNLQLQVDAIEQQTDTGKRRGSLDAPGLLQAIFSNF